MRGSGELEAAVMHRVWDRDGRATVREVASDLQPIAYTTVLTVMENLRRKGRLDRTPAGRAHCYIALTGRDEYVAGLMRQALDDSDDSGLALSHFVRQMTVEDAAALRQALALHAGDIPLDRSGGYSDNASGAQGT
jgi:predicted transcriptional regulator